ncbi:transcriptional regulator, TetR family [Gracilibacillus ureilyticus]|uniref:Transcriptional regulator, TetR family n=1 Tax=Gracilibacillus ureilyticus TaxID=531814 RepID=A0A1H9QN43_9BACI|nr:TetR/AcrR family transcriptional regulator [Gracilibacillus ureilyticus]SER61882.1 transcriptional regulator, TetR family [Gracilibacillus ureilyticus]
MSKNKQEDIFQAAMELFGKRGYDGTTVPMIADKAKVGAGTIYRYFENKESLVNALFVKCVEQFFDAIRKDFPQNSEVRQQFNHIFRRMFVFAKDNSNALQFINSHDEGYYLNEKSNQTFQDFLGFFRNVIEEGIDQGVIRPLPTNAHIAIVYGAFGMLFSHIQSGRMEETPELLNELEESLWNAIRVN